MVESLRLASDADVTMSGSFQSTVVENQASCDGRPSGDCSLDFNLGFEGEDSEEVTFDPDYVCYCGIPYVESKVSFSRSFIKVSSETIYGIEGNFRIILEIEDIVKIESQWSARFKKGKINISFISKDAVKVDGRHDSSASGIQELVFPADDSNWYEKLEAIECLDAKYRALWSVLLDTGREQPSAIPEQNTTLLTRSYLPNFDRPFEEVIYPKGDPDAVSISKRDVDLLLPDTFLNDTIIDFYIKYLKTKQNAEEKAKFHFFNSFFFRKLADVDKDPLSVFDGRGAFLRVRKWTRKVNLDEKDFIFIPVNYNYHWSLIVICYFAEIASYTDSGSQKSARVPCILHMDSLKGTHAGLKDLFQSYLLEEWKERHGGSCEDLNSQFGNLKFVPLELPQQRNSYDCGLFLLHYVELFLEGVPPNFSIYNVTACSRFLQPDWFPPLEASMKRTQIEKLISSLLDTQSDNVSPPGAGMDCCHEDLKTTHAYDNDLQNSDCWRNDGQGIQMTLLPPSSTASQCAETSELVLSQLLQPAISPHAFDAPAWEAFDSRSSLGDIKEFPPPTEEDAECLNDDRRSSGGFMMEAVAQLSLESSPAASELPVAEEIISYMVLTGDQNCSSYPGPDGSASSSSEEASKRLRIAENRDDDGVDEPHASKRKRNMILDHSGEACL